MEYMALGDFIKYGTPSTLLILIVMNVVQMVMIRRQSKDIEGIKKCITWKDTCDERHKVIDRDIERLIHKIFNGD